MKTLSEISRPIFDVLAVKRLGDALDRLTAEMRELKRTNPEAFDRIARRFVELQERFKGEMK